MPPFPTDVEIATHIVDVHAHPTDSLIPHALLDDPGHTICAMATRRNDQARVAALARAHPKRVVPGFGYHPWFTHLIYVPEGVDPAHLGERAGLVQDPTPKKEEKPPKWAIFQDLLARLPDPVCLTDVLDELRRNIKAFPGAILGEVGLDRAFRVPMAGKYAGEGEGEHANANPTNPTASISPTTPTLSPFTVPIAHQLAILEAQVALAITLRAMGESVHARRDIAPKHTVDFMARMKERYGDRWRAISVDLHSCGLSAEVWRSVEAAHPNAFLSLSTGINMRQPHGSAPADPNAPPPIPKSLSTLILSAHPSRLLAESDWHSADESGQRTWEMLNIIARVKGWDVEGVSGRGGAERPESFSQGREGAERQGREGREGDKGGQGGEEHRLYGGNDRGEGRHHHHPRPLHLPRPEALRRGGGGGRG
uniref:TatD DNase family Scn1 n=1 Tax=Schizophyllum commune (strain H4-8 / FGSC 9210) TaxID=578458 RepID=D8PQ97_SCHCM